MRSLRQCKAWRDRSCTSGRGVCEARQVSSVSERHDKACVRTNHLWFDGCLSYRSGAVRKLRTEFLPTVRSRTRLERPCATAT